jgi:hypothetical protein
METVRSLVRLIPRSDVLGGDLLLLAGWGDPSGTLLGHWSTGGHGF